MKKEKQTVDRLWYKATLAPAAAALFTDSFYPTPKRGSGAQHVYFTQVDLTPTSQKVIVASELEASGLRMMTRDLATKTAQWVRPACRLSAVSAQAGIYFVGKG